MTDTVTIRRELLERLADKNASLHHTRKAQDELRAAIDSAPCDPRCAETCVRASMCATCMNALAAPVQGVNAQLLEALKEIAWSNDSTWQSDKAEAAIAAARKGE